MSIFSTSAARRSVGAALAAALFAVAAPAQAALTVFTDRDSYLAALGSHGVDDFDDLLPGEALAGPLQRQAGSLAYRVSVPDVNGLGAANLGDFFYPVAPGGSPALSPNYAAYALAFEALGGPLRGFGAELSTTDLDGGYAAGQLRISVMVAGVEQVFDLTTGNQAGFWGVLSSGDDISAWAFAGLQGSAGDRYATADNLVLAAVNAVPEPSTLALLLAGAFGLLIVRRR